MVVMGPVMIWIWGYPQWLWKQHISYREVAKKRGSLKQSCCIYGWYCGRNPAPVDRFIQGGAGFFSIHSISTWWLIPLSKWVITPVISGISRVNPLITGVITHLLSGMSHQVNYSKLECRNMKKSVVLVRWHDLAAIPRTYHLVMTNIAMENPLEMEVYSWEHHL